jgi:hypothetical protein
MKAGSGNTRSFGAVSLALILSILVFGTAGASPVRPAPYSDTSTPTNTIISYYNAVDRGELTRAYSYLAVQSRPRLHQLEQDYADTIYVRLGAMRLLGYQEVSSVHAAMCVSVHFTSLDRQGQQHRYHGWYIVESSTGQEPAFGAWRINLAASHIVLNRRGLQPMQEQRCHVI